ncbi:MAG: type II secretion system F family protein [Treponema sp.]|nr:type II secretion system F family protein [Treponema sp.]
MRNATNEKELALSFSENGQYLISCKIVEEVNLFKTKKHFNKKIILEFTDIMASLLRAGLTLQDALDLCSSISVNAKTSVLSKTILDGLNRGMPFYEVLKIYTSSFSPLYRSLIRLGEKTGSVGSVFSRISSYLQAEKKIRGKLGNILWYPLLILGIAVTGCFGIIFYVMPRMTDIFSAFNNNIAETNITLDNIYRSLWISLGIIIIFAVTALFIFIFRRMSKSFAFFIDAAVLSLPLVGPFIQSLQTLDFSFAMEMLTGSGITINNALKESADVVTNRAFSNAILEVYEKILRGEKLSSSFLDNKAFPEYIGTWMAVGEKTGAVEPVFSQVRTFFQADVEHGSERLMGIIEPALTLLIGIMVLILIIQFVLPIFSLYGRII